MKFVFCFLALVALTAVAADLVSNTATPIKLVKPSIINPLDDPSKADELAGLAHLLATEPTSAAKKADAAGYGAGPAKVDPSHPDMVAGKDDVKLLGDDDSCPKEGKCDAAKKEQKAEDAAEGAEVKKLTEEEQKAKDAENKVDFIEEAASDSDALLEVPTTVVDSSEPVEPKKSDDSDALLEVAPIAPKSDDDSDALIEAAPIAPKKSDDDSDALLQQE